MAFTVADTLRWWAKHRSDMIAFCVDGAAVTFAELHDWSNRIAHRLDTLGVKQGDVVMMCGVNSLEYAALINGLIYRGAIGGPVTFRSSASEISRYGDEYKPVAVFTDAEHKKVVEAGLGPSYSDKIHSFSDLEDLRTGTPKDYRIDIDRDAPLFLMSTSGSTGAPKSVLYTNFAVMTYACEFAIAERWQGMDGRFLNLGPFSSGTGYLLSLQFLINGMSVYMLRRIDGDAALQALVDLRITHFLGVPVFFERVSKSENFSEADLSKLQFAMVAGARVDRALLDTWARKGVILRQAYGCSEAGGGWAASESTAMSEPEKAGSGGPFNEFAIMDEKGNILPPNQVGEIVSRGAASMAGYWNDPEATEALMCNGWLRTGDLGKVDELGNVTFIDRLKEIIISGGLNISAAEVERVIAEVEHVKEVVVFAAPDPNFGETPVVIVHGDDEISTSDIIEHCDKMLASYKVPRYVLITNEPLPRLPSGKISKQETRSIYKDKLENLPKVR